VKTPKSRATRERVLAAAVALFAREGYEKATMRDLSREAELGLGALYYYFKSKEELVQAFYEELNATVVERFEQERDRDSSWQEQLGHLLRLKLQLLEPHRGLLRVLLREAVDPDSSLSPLHRRSQKARDVSEAAFEELAPGQGRVLWLAHLALLGFWLHDRSPGQRVTHQVLGFLPWLPRLPPQLVKLVDDWAGA